MDARTPNAPNKKDVLVGYLAESSVYLHLDPRRKGVVVPKFFQSQTELVLQLGLNMAIPIMDLEVGDDSVSCTLSFNRSPFWCSLPWTAIFAIVSDKDKRGVIWPEDVPVDGQAAQNLRRDAAPVPPKKERPKLTALGPNDRLPPPESSPGEIEARAVADGAKCASCGTKWVEDQSSCPVCGASASEALPTEALPLEKVALGDPEMGDAEGGSQKKGTKKKAAKPAGAKRSRKKDGASSPESTDSVPSSQEPASAAPSLAEDGNGARDGAAGTAKKKRAPAKGKAASKLLAPAASDPSPVTPIASLKTPSTRPTLSALPSPVLAPVRSLEPAASSAEAADSSPPEKSAGQTSPGSNADAPKKGTKRPLPPYLRVVK